MGTQYIIVQYSTVLYSTVQQISQPGKLVTKEQENGHIVHYSIVQYCTVQYSTENIPTRKIGNEGVGKKENLDTAAGLRLYRVQIRIQWTMYYSTSSSWFRQAATISASSPKHHHSSIPSLPLHLKGTVREIGKLGSNVPFLMLITLT